MAFLLIKTLCNTRHQLNKDVYYKKLEALQKDLIVQHSTFNFGSPLCLKPSYLPTILHVIGGIAILIYSIIIIAVMFYINRGFVVNCIGWLCIWNYNIATINTAKAIVKYDLLLSGSDIRKAPFNIYWNLYTIIVECVFYVIAITKLTQMIL